MKTQHILKASIALTVAQSDGGFILKVQKPLIENVGCDTLIGRCEL